MYANICSVPSRSATLCLPLAAPMVSSEIQSIFHTHYLLNLFTILDSSLFLVLAKLSRYTVLNLPTYVKYVALQDRLDTSPYPALQRF
jgi:hypothetical protein